MTARSLSLSWAWGMLILGLVLVGCSGDDGAPGADGPEGPEGPQGTPGNLAGPFLRSDLATTIEACAVCHGPGAAHDVDVVHGEGEDVLLPSVLDPIDASVDGFLLDGVPLVSQITDVTIGDPDTVTFDLMTEEHGAAVLGLVSFWNDSNRFVRFTVTQLLPGIPDSWVAYTRDTINDGSTRPDYDTGSALVDNGGGSYTLTLLTDIENVTGVSYDSNLTHRVAGQIGSGGAPIDPQNMVLDFVPTGKSVSNTRNIAVMDSCNECHDDLVFHGRRFKVEYCVQCHNPDLATGEGNMSFMTHRIHAAGSFAVLDNAISYNELTYPQDLKNCRKCHSAGASMGVTTTSEGDNWQNVPNKAACDGCHGEFEGDTFDNYHTGGPQSDNNGCSACHSASAIEGYHVTDNPSSHNPLLQANQREISYELVDADVVAGQAIITFRILSDGTPLDVTNLPSEFEDAAGIAFRYPGLLLAWAQPQDGILAPADFNNLGRRGAQPLSISLGALAPIDATSTIGSLSWDPAGKSNTATINVASSFPTVGTMRTVGLQGYLQQDLDDDGADDVSLHTPSKMVTVTGDDARRQIVDNNKCASCHEWFDGHGGNRVFTFGSTEQLICTMCHTTNTSSSGRTITTIDQRLTDSFDDWEAEHGPITHFDRNDPLTYPEDAQNLKDMIHGIHSEGFRTRDFEHVRGGRNGYWNWSHVTFPRGAETSNCQLCHLDDTYELPLDPNALPTTVRTTSVDDGDDPDSASVEGAFQGVPNQTDWVNTPMASACGFCHTWDQAVAHMRTMGGLLNDSAFAK